MTAPRLTATIPNKVKVEPKLEPKPDVNKGQTKLSTVQFKNEAKVPPKQEVKAF
jgi:hypothetical protein